MEKEGEFRLEATVGQSITQPNKWHSAGYVHAPDESEALEVIKAGASFETREEARAAAITAARDIARALAPGDSLARRKAAG